MKQPILALDQTVEEFIKKIKPGDPCPYCGEKVTGVTQTMRSKHVSIDHGHWETVSWSDGLGQVFKGERCKVICRDTIVCETDGCYCAPQNAAVTKCCSCLCRGK